MTAKDIQTAVINKYSHKDICMANFFYHFWECDVFRLQSNGFIIEYEVKMTKQDFHADFQKKQGGLDKHKHISLGNRCNRFFFVTPVGLLKAGEIPPHCGLIEYNGASLYVVKKAKLLHKNTVDSSYFKELAMKFYYRLRDSKLNLPKNNI